MSIIIHGKNAVREALKSGRTIHELYVLEKQHFDFLDKKILDAIPTRFLSKNEIHKKLPTGHQGIGAKVDSYHSLKLTDVLKKRGKKLFVMLDSIEDPHNLGAVLRSADAFAVTGVIVPKHRSVSINSTVVKVSTGAIEYVKIIEVTNLNQAIKTLQEHDVWIVGTDANTKHNLDYIQADLDLCVVFGSEGKGLHRLVKENCDYLVKIPMVGHVNSLNVSVSCGIVLHDIMRRRKT